MFLIAILFTIKGVSQIVIPPSFKKAVAFIFALNDSGVIVPYGTGFYVSVNQNENKSAGYIVTAKHVLKNQSGSYLDKIFVRLSQISDSALVIIPITLHASGTAKNIYTHFDTTVDIAVISETPRQDKFDYIFLPSTFITTRKDFDLLNIKEGDEVFFTGMFTQYLGEKANYPITRFGKVSLVTNEKVLWNGNYRNLYLL